MHVEVFKGSNDIYALTQEPHGENLPNDGGPWTYQGPSELQVTDGSFYGLDASKALWEMATHGYVLTRLVDTPGWPATPPG